MEHRCFFKIQRKNRRQIQIRNIDEITSAPQIN